MFWADRIAGEVEARFGTSKAIMIRDEKTLSGRVHIGAMRGVAIHGLVAEALAARGAASVYKYELNDFDPFDSVPSYLDAGTFAEHLGKPLYAVPSPEEGFANYAEFYGADFLEAHKKAGFTPEYYRTYRDLYKTGAMDALIRIALERVADIRRILKEVSGSEKNDSWLPISVVCEQCGKMMTTSASDFDGETVAYVCERNPDGAVACGRSGRVSPFGGNAKLFWKVDWAAKWVAMGVEVEGAGKDHSTKGGSRDVANHIAQEIFDYEPPFDVPYEFFLVGGRKMSSSKGRGSSAREVADLLPGTIFRLALLGKDINQQINFDPEGDTIPTLYDQYDKLAESYWKGVRDDYARLFEYAHPARTTPSEHFLPRFSQVAFMVQMPHLSLEKEVEALKGAPLTAEDREELEERAAYARRWLEQYAPEKYVFKLQDDFPEAARNLTAEQKNAIKSLIEFMEANPNASGEELQSKLHEFKEFKVIYLAFLAKASGPKAGWFLVALDRDFVLKRLKEAAE